MNLDRTLSAGEALFRQGDKSLGFFRVLRGQIRLLRHTADGGVVTLHVARTGERFAEAALFSEHYHCDAIADESSEVQRLNKADWLARLEECPADIRMLLADLARETRTLRARLVLRQTLRAADRVWQALRTGADHAGVFVVPGTLKAWSSELGLSHESLYRTLADLSRRGLIERKAQRTIQMLHHPTSDD